ncbi:MAG: glycosyltransferase family 2 protein [Methyloprofundus sp.]|nr:glycosyltransferase family 2 protein [Methyloprofundus sp.]
MIGLTDKEQCPFFTVVIPLYNKGVHIVPTLMSVLAQSFRNFEVIVVDDGSTDDSLEKVQSVVDERIKVIHQNNQGVSVARNRGIQEAKGEYIAFLDADDFWYEWHLDELHRLTSNFRGYGVYSVAHEICRDKKLFTPRTWGGESGFCGVVDNFYAAFSESLSLVNSTTACLPRDLLLEIKGFPEGIKKGEDVYVWLKAASLKGLVYSSKICARYNQDAQSRSNLNLSDEIPFYLVWLNKSFIREEVPTHLKNSAKKFFEAGIFYNAAGFRLDGNLKALSKLKELNIPLRLRFFITILKFLPKGLLSLAKKYRHKEK